MLRKNKVTDCLSNASGALVFQRFEEGKQHLRDALYLIDKDPGGISVLEVREQAEDLERSLRLQKPLPNEKTSGSRIVEAFISLLPIKWSVNK